MISLLITVAIIGLLVWGAWFMTSKNKRQNQIQQDQSAIDQAKNAASQENGYDQSIQENLDTGSNVNYRAVQQKLK